MSGFGRCPRTPCMIRDGTESNRRSDSVERLCQAVVAGRASNRDAPPWIADDWTQTTGFA